MKTAVVKLNWKLEAGAGGPQQVRSLIEIDLPDPLDGPAGRIEFAMQHADAGIAAWFYHVDGRIARVETADYADIVAGQIEPRLVPETSRMLTHPGGYPYRHIYPAYWVI